MSSPHLWVVERKGFGEREWMPFNVQDNWTREDARKVIRGIAKIWIGNRLRAEYRIRKYVRAA